MYTMLIVEVSVPLRGYGFEIAQTGLRMSGDCPVSVPLRGYGFEIINIRASIVVIPNSFRPLAGIWF